MDGENLSTGSYAWTPPGQSFGFDATSPSPARFICYKDINRPSPPPVPR
jgi:glyoxylate utilization-related uncharacterized protein